MAMMMVVDGGVGDDDFTMVIIFSSLIPCEGFVMNPLSSGLLLQ